MAPWSCVHLRPRSQASVLWVSQSLAMGYLPGLPVLSGISGRSGCLWTQGKWLDNGVTGSNQYPTFTTAAGRGYQPDEGELRKDLVASTTMGSLNAPTCIRL